MRAILHLTAADARRQPWQNGRGITEELALWPLGATLARGDVDWRISKAKVDESGPFSSFSGYERILVVTAGDGLVVMHGEHAPRARLRPLEPHRFSGDWPTTCALVSGPVADFNVLCRRGVVSASVEVLKLGRRRARESLQIGHAFLHVIRGGVRARVTNEEDAFALEPGESLWARSLPREEELELEGTTDDSVVLLTSIEDRAR